jgi:cytochrome c-type biogenesis protein CcmH
MTAFLACAALLCALTVALLARRRWWPGAAGGASVRALRQQMQALRALHEAGTLSAEQFEASRAALERRAVESISAPVAAAGDAPSPKFIAGLAMFVVLVVAGGYTWIGSPGSLPLGPGAGSAMPASGAADAGAANADANAPHAVTSEQIAAMVDRLAQRLKDKPDDAEGWTMLARSYVVLGRHADAVEAFRHATQLRPEDATLLADFADALAVTQQRRLEGEPMQLVERALKLEPGNVKALALAGTAAFDRQDYAGAVRQWEQALKGEPAGSDFARQLQADIAQARQQAGGALPAPAETAAASSAPSAATAPAARISGTVELSPSLAAMASPEDTVFVFARAAQGPRMPLAILRRQVKDLPLRFTLDDSMAMSPAARLSTAGRVIVGVRVSKSGNAIAQPGDLQGASGEVAVGADGLRIVIDQAVR